MMTRDDFEHALLLHGSDLATWPDAAGARQLLAEDEPARALLDEARRLDFILAEATAYPPLDSASIGRVISRHRRGTAPGPLAFGRLAAATALVASVMVGGFVLGGANAVDAAHADISLVALASGNIDLLGDLP